MIDVFELIQRGESTYLEFKGRDTRPESLAREFVALSNTYGGVLLLGVEDDGHISGMKEGIAEEWISNISANSINPSICPKIEIQTIEGKKIAVITIEKGKHKPYQTIEGKYWIRIGSTNRTATKEELSRLFQEAGLVHFDLSPIDSSSIEDLDPNKLHEYWNTHYSINYEKLYTDEKVKLLTNANILLEWEEKIVCSLAGILIFGKRPQQKVLQASVVFAAFHGNELTDSLADKKEIIGTLPEQIEQLQSILHLLTPTPSQIENYKRIEFPEIPQKVLRELLVNAILHRDYSIRNRKTMIQLFSNRLVIASPGRIANTLDIEKIKVGNSAPRNMLLLKFMDNLRYIDGLGRGIPMVIREMGDKVHFEEIGDEFRVIVYRKK